ncbi:MAG: Na/Pi cotransporter family protein [Acutalibacteraceae bacterium]|nr:Na/Pi cotransporter family protein [Acutalibacteraceae bacterium]
MSSTQILLMVAELLGGLAFFLYGMSTLSDGLENVAGGALEKTLKKVTKNQFLSFFLGAGITIAIQSSSAMTVMLIGLVNSGIVNFCDTFGIIMGSNVGTTLTAWMLSLTGISGDNFFLTLLKPMTFAPILAFVGILLRMVSKQEKKKNVGLILIGFAVLMTGMDFMSDSMSAVQEMEGFQSLLFAFSSPMIALLISMLFTGVIQSSAATIGIVQALALTGSITYEMAIPLVLGANIGTCITALISSFGTNKNAKRVVAMHIYVNVIGSVLCLILLYVAEFAEVALIKEPVSMIGVAMIHTLFNFVNTIILVPFRKAVIRLCELTVKKNDGKTHTVFLDERLFNNTALAVSECHRLTSEMAKHARESLLKSISVVSNYDAQTVQFIRENEELIDKYEDKLGTYLVRLSNNEQSETTAHSIARMLHSIGDFERIGDHALNICKVAEEMHDKNIHFSNDAMKEIETITAAVAEILNMTIDSFVSDDIEKASHVEPLEQVIDKLKKELKARHINRLQNGECTIELGFIFTDLLTNYERVSDHCSNIAVYTMQLPTDMLDTHKYLHKLKSSLNSTFVDDFNNYSEKYNLDT